MSNLLVVDWDFFFPNPAEAGEMSDPLYWAFDWGHREAPFFLSTMIWTSRATVFLHGGHPLPSVQPPEGGWAAFWSRFRFTEHATMTYGDSNMWAGQVRPPEDDPYLAFDSVVLFDAHHDSGYNLASVDAWEEQGHYSCEDWMLVHQSAGTEDLTVRYPTWKPSGPAEPLPEGVLTRQMVDDGAPLATEFDTVYVCRSGAWVPAWCDQDFLAFLAACPLPGTQVDEEPMDRGFDPATAQAMAAGFNDPRLTGTIGD